MQYKNSFETFLFIVYGVVRGQCLFLPFGSSMTTFCSPLAPVATYVQSSALFFVASKCNEVPFLVTLKMSIIALSKWIGMWLGLDSFMFPTPPVCWVCKNCGCKFFKTWVSFSYCFFNYSTSHPIFFGNPDYKHIKTSTTPFTETLIIFSVTYSVYNISFCFSIFM